MVRSSLAEIPGWVAVAAMVAGTLLCVATGALPERWQDAGLYLGVGLVFASVGGTLVNLMISARSSWRGTATISGSILGALPLLFVAWYNIRARPVTVPPLPVSRATVVAASTAGAAGHPESQAASRGTPAGPTQLEPVLAEIAEVLKKKARPALDQAATTLRRGRERELPPAAVRSQLSDTARELEEARTSLQDIQSRHDGLSAQLTSVI